MIKAQIAFCKAHRSFSSSASLPACRRRGCRTAGGDENGVAAAGISGGSSAPRPATTGALCRASTGQALPVKAESRACGWAVWSLYQICLCRCGSPCTGAFENGRQTLRHARRGTASPPPAERCWRVFPAGASPARATTGHREIRAISVGNICDIGGDRPCQKR